jgi:protein-S-isoprenylcysteine O-methyltransferase Ste14
LDEIFFKASLGVLIVFFFLIRAPSVMKASKTEKVKDDKPQRERILVLLNFIGMIGLPVVYILTPWLDQFRINAPEIIRVSGIVFYTLGLLLLIWVHWTLGQHWSMMLKLGQNHNLVTGGPYSRIRHPMYTYFYIMVIATALISTNLLVGTFGIIAWTLLYLVRINDEESMLLEEFGEEYQAYMEQTGRLIPKLKS